jgi:hypothetical protein
MANVLKKTIIGLAAVSSVVVAAAPADAQYRRRHRGDDDAAWAIGAGIVGLGLGAAIASGNRGGYYDRGYYGDGYYGRGYGYDRGYGYGSGYGYGYGRRHCVTRREFDPYWGRWVRVRYC